MPKLALVSLVIATFALAAPSAAAADPSLRANPSHGEPGDDVTLRGRGWTVGDGCANRIVLLFKQGDTRMKLGQAAHGGGSFSFETHFQPADPGPARFIAKQDCGTVVNRRVAHVTIGQGQAEAVRYRGQTEHGGRVRFTVIDGDVVTDFRFMNRCSTDRRRGSLVPGSMAIGDVSFSRRGGRFRIRGRFGASGMVKGRARELVGGCDSAKMTWRARRVR